MTPTQRTIKLLKERGYTVQIVEKWNSWAKVRQDLFGFIDILAMKQGCRLLGIQCTTMANMKARAQKIRASPNYPLWLSTGSNLLVIGWAKRGKRGKRKQWTYKTQDMDLTRDDVENELLALLNGIACQGNNAICSLQRAVLQRAENAEAQRDAAKAQVEKLENMNAELVMDRAKIVLVNATLEAQRDALQGQVDAVTMQREHAYAKIEDGNKHRDKWLEKVAELTTERDRLREALDGTVKLLDDEREKVLKEWNDDPDVPSSTHEQHNCNMKCDAYCILYNTFALVAHKLEHAKAALEET